MGTWTPYALTIGAALGIGVIAVIPARTFGDAPPYKSGIFAVHIETSKTHYKVGEPVEVRISITNVGSRPVRADYLPPWSLCRLLITRQDGSVVPGAGMTLGRVDGNYYFSPGQTIVAAYGDPNDNWRGNKAWFPIEYWNFQKLSPGSYTIVGLPQIFGYELANRSTQPFITPPTDKSNEVHITIAE